MEASLRRLACAILNDPAAPRRRSRQGFERGRNETRPNRCSSENHVSFFARAGGVFREPTSGGRFQPSCAADRRPSPFGPRWRCKAASRLLSHNPHVPPLTFATEREQDGDESLHRGASRFVLPKASDRRLSWHNRAAVGQAASAGAMQRVNVAVPTRAARCPPCGRTRGRLAVRPPALRTRQGLTPGRAPSRWHPGQNAT